MDRRMLAEADLNEPIFKRSLFGGNLSDMVFSPKAYEGFSDSFVDNLSVKAGAFFCIVKVEGN